MKIRVSLYLSYNETEINCKGFICPLSYANKVGDISYFGAHACNHSVCGTYICTLKNMYHKGSNLLTLLLIHFYQASFYTYSWSLLSRYWTHAGLLSNFPLWSSQFPLFSLRQKPPMSRQTWYSISKWGNPKEYFYEFFITILSNYIKRDEITSFSFLIKSWMMNSEPKLFESPNINIDFIRVCKL